MSGGSMDYIYGKIEDMLCQELDLEMRALLKDLAEYLHTEEWYISGDTSVDNYNDALSKFKHKWLSKNSSEERLEQLIVEETDKVKHSLLRVLGKEQYVDCYD